MNLTTIDHILSSSTSDRRFYTTATTAFAILALALAMAGLIVVVSRAVVEQRRELAIRAALGAQEVRLLRLVVRQGMLPAIVGAATGLTGVWVFARVLDGFLFHVTPRAPWAYGGVAVIVLASALGATLLPARRAIRLPPAATLRAE